MLGASVFVKYVDEAGNELALQDELKGNVEETYTTTAKNIAGWQVKTVPSNSTGIFTTTRQTVTYIYEKTDDNNVTPDTGGLPTTGENITTIILFALILMTLSGFLYYQIKKRKHL